jgi:regulator of sirC expression with transglutaminase-like and TPR domain
VDARGRWAELMQLPEDELPLDEAALVISGCAQPGLDVAGQLRRLDDLAGRAGESSVAEVCRTLFTDVGLRGDHESYDDPRNSYLDQVLDRRLGIPISLSVILIEVARRRGLVLEAVGMPGHFLVRDPADPNRLIDSFDGGRILDRAACERLYQAITGGTAPLAPRMLAPTGRWAVLARMLANLDRSFERRGDRAALRWVTELRLAIPQAPIGDRAQLAARLAGMGRFDAAADTLERAAGAVPEADRLRVQALGLRARLN